MEAWARTYKERVQFLCVCVESKGVAIQFSRMFRFRHAVNCYIPSRHYMPVGYGQLGCSGFIVADKGGNFVSRKTQAFLDYGDDAFRHVESLLSSLLPRQDPAAPQEQKMEREIASQSSPSPQLPSVGVQSIDDEHERCSKSLQVLSSVKTIDALLLALKTLQEHFRHEEFLMTKHGFGGGAGESDNFSPFASHARDHQRILDIGRNELKRLEVAALASRCSEGTS